MHSFVNEFLSFVTFYFLIFFYLQVLLDIGLCMVKIWVWDGHRNTRYETA